MGPLEGVKVLELQGLGPGPFCGMLLSDLGADVVRLDRPGHRVPDPSAEIMGRGKRSILLDLKSAEGLQSCLGLVRSADVVIDPYRPGVTERLGIGPRDCLDANPRLVYGHVSGWGRDGPLAPRAGHDINYIALSGALSLSRGPDGRPVPPINMLGDYAGGSMFLAVGVLSALHVARTTGQGQVVDAAMVDGTAYLTALVHQLMAQGAWGEHGTNVLDSGAPYYGVYDTADFRHIAIGAIEPQFYAQLLDVLGLAADPLFAGRQNDRAHWPAQRRRLVEIFKSHSRATWVERFAGTDACFAPVLEVGEVAEDFHMRARKVLSEAFGVRQPSPAPRFSRTTSGINGPPPRPGAHTAEVLAQWCT